LFLNQGAQLTAQLDEYLPALAEAARLPLAGLAMPTLRTLSSAQYQRFRTVGLRDDNNGENLACFWTSTPRHMVVYWMRHWFKETSYGGAHWAQIKDPDFRVAGFGGERGCARLIRSNDPNERERAYGHWLDSVNGFHGSSILVFKKCPALPPQSRSEACVVR